MSFINVIKRDQYEILQLNRGKANPMNTDVVKDIRTELARIKQDTATRALILTGNTPGYFTVGLDLKELYYYDEKQIQEFWEHWDAMVIEMVQFPKPIIAAINGYSPAGGCVLAVTCDYRMMAAGEKFIIGLNEVAVGITVPENIFQLYAFWLGKRQAYHNLMQGRLMSVAEAKACNLIDEVHPMEELLTKAEERLQRLLLLPDNILQGSKKSMRAELIERLENIPEVSTQQKLDLWFDPRSRAIMKMVVDSLTK